MADSLIFNIHRYGQEHELQRLATWQLQNSESSSAGRWIIFIHGGAWRDPTNTYRDFVPTINAILSSGSLPPRSIRGFASVDYRLSAHPSHPQDASVPAEQVRRAHHPDHIRDVCAALAYMQKTHGLDDDYILVGHSVGATLAFQALMGKQATQCELSTTDMPHPAAMIGIAGIYEFYDFAHRHGGPYIGMVEGALGPDHSVWNDAAPLHFKGTYAAAWRGRHEALLAYSPGDSLVDGHRETMAMAKRLQADGIKQTVSTIDGEHDFAWQDGKQIASLIAQVNAKLKVD